MSENKKKTTKKTIKTTNTKKDTDNKVLLLESVQADIPDPDKIESPNNPDPKIKTSKKDKQNNLQMKNNDKSK